MRYDMLFGNRVARAVELANVAVRAEILNTELPGLIFHKRQVRRDEARPKTGAVLFVDQAAVAPKLAEANLIKTGIAWTSLPPLWCARAG